MEHNLTEDDLALALELTGIFAEFLTHWRASRRFFGDMLSADCVGEDRNLLEQSFERASAMVVDSAIHAWGWAHVAEELEQRRAGSCPDCGDVIVSTPEVDVLSGIIWQLSDDELVN